MAIFDSHDDDEDLIDDDEILDGEETDEYPVLEREADRVRDEADHQRYSRRDDSTSGLEN